MSVSMTKAEGVTVFTVTTKPGSRWPLLCQILGTLCYSPVCSVSVSQGLRRLQAGSQSALGTIQIMVGLLNIGIGTVLTINQRSPLAWEGTPYWIGAVFIVVGIMCILADKFPSPCVVGINVLLNLAGVGMAITAIVLYAIDLSDGKLWGRCSDYNFYDYHESPPTLSPDHEKCLELKQFTVWLLNGIDVVLIVLAVLQLCVTISSVVLGIKALCKNQEEGKENIQDKDGYKPLVEEA